MEFWSKRKKDDRALSHTQSGGIESHTSWTSFLSVPFFGGGSTQEEVVLNHAATLIFRGRENVPQLNLSRIEDIANVNEIRDICSSKNVKMSRREKRRTNLIRRYVKHADTKFHSDTTMKGVKVALKRHRKKQIRDFFDVSCCTLEPWCDDISCMELMCLYLAVSVLCFPCVQCCVIFDTCMQKKKKDTTEEQEGQERSIS